MSGTEYDSKTGGIVIQPQSDWTTENYLSVYSALVTQGANPDVAGNTVLGAMVGQGYNPQLSESQLYTVKPFNASAQLQPISKTDSSATIQNAIGTGLSLVNPALGAGFNAATSVQRSGGATSWIESHIGNFSLIAFGAVLAIGALMFSQRENVTKIVSTVGKVAAVAA